MRLNILFMLRKAFQDDESIDFLREEPRFQALIRKLEQLYDRLTDK